MRLFPLRAVAALVLACGPFAATTVLAQTYPSRPITLIVPFAPGGSTDVIARVVAEALHKELGVPVLVDNRAGAGGSLGMAAIVKAAPDGYTIGMGSASTLAINPAVYKNLTFDVMRDLAPITNVAVVPNIMSVNPAVAAATLADFVRIARAEPGKFAYGSAGNGSVAHLMGEQFRASAGVDIVHVPYRGQGPANNDAVAGQIQVLFDNLPTSLALVEGGKLRALAVSSRERLPALPDVPTFAELGLSELDWMGFFGLVAPAGTPAAIVTRLHAAALAGLKTPQVADILLSQQATAVGNTPAEFAAEIARELARFRKAAAAAKISVD